MTRVLITAFEPYDVWSENASWLALVELTRELPDEPEITTRRYPVDYAALAERLEHDLAAGYDYVILTGQAPGRPRLEIETTALNMRAPGPRDHESCQPLIPTGPLAYASDLPAAEICQRIRAAGIPISVSRHAGTFLCNAALYFTLHQIATEHHSTRALFLHLPIDPRQAAAHREPIASLPSALTADAIRILLHCLPRKVEWV